MKPFQLGAYVKAIRFVAKVQDPLEAWLILPRVGPFLSPFGAIPTWKLSRESCTPTHETPKSYQNDHQIVHLQWFGKASKNRRNDKIPKTNWKQNHLRRHLILNFVLHLYRCVKITEFRTRNLNFHYYIVLCSELVLSWSSTQDCLCVCLLVFVRCVFVIWPQRSIPPKTITNTSVAAKR